MRLADTTAIVTGGGSGIGRAIADALRRRGRLGGRRRPRRRAGRDGRRRARGRARGARRRHARGRRRAARARGDGGVGRVDVLVNNAGFGDADDVLEIDEEAWDREVAINLKATFLCSRAVLPGMIERGGGVIVNIASVNGMAFFANEAYSAAKAGMINLTRSMAVRYGRHGIRVNAIAPGTIRTPLWQERVDKEPAIFERLVRWYPLGRVGEPDDVARPPCSSPRTTPAGSPARSPRRRRPARRQRADGARARRELLRRRDVSCCSTSDSRRPRDRRRRQSVVRAPTSASPATGSPRSAAWPESRPGG